MEYLPPPKPTTKYPTRLDQAPPKYRVSPTAPVGAGPNVCQPACLATLDVAQPPSGPSGNVAQPPSHAPLVPHITQRPRDAAPVPNVTQAACLASCVRMALAAERL